MSWWGLRLVVQRTANLSELLVLTNESKILRISAAICSFCDSIIFSSFSIFCSSFELFSWRSQNICSRLLWYSRLELRCDSSIIGLLHCCHIVWLQWNLFFSTMNRVWCIAKIERTNWSSSNKSQTHWKWYKFISTTTAYIVFNQQYVSCGLLLRLCLFFTTFTRQEYWIFLWWFF